MPLQKVRLKLMTLTVLDKLFSSFRRTKKICAKLTSINFWFSNALSTPFQARNCHRKIADLLPIQNDNKPF